MREHTPEPWEMSDTPYTSPDLSGEGLNFSNGDWGIYPPLGESGPIAEVNSQANAARIIGCVNACEGMPDPGAAIDSLVDQIATLTVQRHALLEAAKAILEHPGGVNRTALRAAITKATQAQT